MFTPHLVPMTRGIFTTIYAKGKVSTERCLEAARGFYAKRPFVRVMDKPPHTKWATGTNLVFVSYACDPARNLVIAMGACDNLGKGPPVRRCRTRISAPVNPRRWGSRARRCGPELKGAPPAIISSLGMLGVEPI